MLTNCFLELYQRFHLLSRLCRCKEKVFHALRHRLFTSRSIMLLPKACFHRLYFETNLLFFSFLSAISEKQESPVSKGLKFKNSKNYLARKSFIDKVIFDRFFVL